MANVTLAVPDDVLLKARIRALQQGTTVNALVRDYLASFVGKPPANQGVADFLEIANRTAASSGKPGRSWTRDDAHAR